MRLSTMVMIGFAALFGLLAVFLAQGWLNSQAEMRAKNLDARKKPLATQTLVVAGKPLRYGAELTAQSLREIPWPDAPLPEGAFAKIDDILKDGKRIVLTAIEPNEAVLAVKITGSGQRATLSALVGPGMKAVTIRVNDVEGVGGHVLPGDRVDVALTRQLDKENGSTQVVLQDVRVLAIDQVADERASNAGGRKIGDARGRHARSAEARAGRIHRYAVAASAQSRRNGFREVVAHHHQGFVQRANPRSGPRIIHHDHGQSGKRQGDRQGRLQRADRG